MHRAPGAGHDPDRFLSAVLDVVRSRRIDVLLPVHEQAYLFAAARKRLPGGLAVALADFGAFEQVQSKAGLAELLAKLNVPQPRTEVVRSAEEFVRERPYPFFVKAAFGTASAGVWRVGDARRRDALLGELQARDAFAQPIVAQAAITGALERTQAVFDFGRLVACHIYRQMAEGPGGGDVLKLSVNNAQVREIVRSIGRALSWHGALSFDYIREEATDVPHFIDGNPRLVEPMNAWLSGVDLPGALLKVSLGEAPPEQPEGRAGVMTRLGLMGLMDAARRNNRRRDVLGEIVLLAANSGRYRGTREELVPLWTDPYCAVPLAFVMAKLLYSPQAASRFNSSTVAAYSLTPAAIHRLRTWHQSA